MTTAGVGHELEIKLNLSAEEYNRLLAALPDRVERLTQQNLFLDTEDGQLKALRWVLRVRRQQGAGQAPRLIVTVKGAATRMAGAVRRQEVETDGTEELWTRATAGGLPLTALEGGPAALLRTVLDPEATLLPVLQFSNHRTCFRVPLGGAARLVELDRTTFDSREVDHELELELPAVSSSSDAEAALEIRVVSEALQSLLARHGITVQHSESGKYARALRYAGRA